MFKMQDWKVPSTTKILYLCSFRKVRKKEGRDSFYTLMKYTKPGINYKVSCGNDNHARDYKDKFFFAGGFHTRTHPTLLLNFAWVGKYILRALESNSFLLP